MGNWGEIRLGRDFVPDFWNHGLFDPFGTTGVGSSVNAFGTFNGATTLVRANNSVAYFLPPMGGLYGQAMVAAGEGVPNQGNKHKAARVGYKTGPVDVAASIGHTDGAIGGWKRFNVVGSYSFGDVKVLGQYASSKGAGGPDDGAKQVLWLLGITSTVGLHEFKASYLKSDGSGTIRFGVTAPTSIETRDATQLH
jgi:predicted porin